jgi:hypothetical protein
MSDLIDREQAKKYASHLLSCQRLHVQMNTKPDVCDCGYDELFLKKQPEPESLPKVLIAQPLQRT